MNSPKFSVVAMCLLCLTAFSFASAQETNQDPRQAESQRPQPIGPDLVVPAGTSIPVVLSAYLNSHSTQVGDYFYMDTVYPIWIQQVLAIPKGSTIRGTVTEVVRPGKIKGRGKIAIRFENILLPNGISRDLNASFHGIHGGGDESMDRQKESVEAGGSKAQDVGTIIGYSGSGAIIGAIADHGMGAGIGAGAGAAVGLATILLTRGRDLIIEPGTQFDIELKQPLRFAYGELRFTNDQMNSARHITAPRPSPYNQNQKRPWHVPGFGFPIPWFYALR